MPPGLKWKRLSPVNASCERQRPDRATMPATRAISSSSAVRRPGVAGVSIRRPPMRTPTAPAAIASRSVPDVSPESDAASRGASTAPPAPWDSCHQTAAPTSAVATTGQSGFRGRARSAPR